MGIYERCWLPAILDFACSFRAVRDQRSRVVPLAEGRVLEVGIGSGLNLPFYDRSKVEAVWGVEPSEGMRRKAQGNLANAPFPVRWLPQPCADLPLDDGSIDTVLLTYTLCSIADPLPAMAELRRVLAPSGRLVFCEHGRAPDPAVRDWQQRLNPLWGKLAGGCQLDRPVPKLLEDGGFAIDALESRYLEGPQFASFTYWGTARLDIPARYGD